MLIAGVPTGFIELDFMTNGLLPGDLVLLAGRAGVGKTALALAITKRTSVEAKKVVTYFSLKATEEVVLSRLLCSEACVHTQRAMTTIMSREEWMRLEAAQKVFAGAKLFIDDSCRSPVSIRAKAEDVQAYTGLDLIVIDNIQLLRSENQPWGYRLSRELKHLAMDLRVPVIALSQLPRQPHDRVDHRPLPIDLSVRDDNSLAQDPDIILFVHREEMFGRTQENERMVDLFVYKNRTGVTGAIRLVLLHEFVRMENGFGPDGSPPPVISEESMSASREYLANLLRHSQDKLIRLTANEGEASVDCSVSIFKSSQEEDFYNAAVQAYPNLKVYPNVALSCLFDFEKVSPHLSREERMFFFKGTVDCVVFDRKNMPRHFFELDSMYHDNSEQQRRDAYKDNIFSRAGCKLYRVRRLAPNLGREEFLKLIKEVAGEEGDEVSGGEHSVF